jgi:hypothetical protein
VFGSIGRGDAGVGSDLERLLVLRECVLPNLRRPPWAPRSPPGNPERVVPEEAPMRPASRPRPRTGHPNGTGTAGFVLPLATLAGMVMVLSSLSLLGTALAGRQAQVAEERRRQDEDALNSAAQVVVDRLQTSHACLAPFPSNQWDPLPSSCLQQGPIDLAQVRQVGDGKKSTRLLEWQPRAASARLRLQLTNAQAPGQSLSARRSGSFLLELEPQTARVIGLRQEGS